MYDPRVGQFLSADPIEDDKENTYRYVGNSPTNATDPTGLQEHSQASGDFDWFGENVNNASGDFDWFGHDVIKQRHLPKAPPGADRYAHYWPSGETTQACAWDDGARLLKLPPSKVDSYPTSTEYKDGPVKKLEVDVIVTPHFEGIRGKFEYENRLAKARKPYQEIGVLIKFNIYELQYPDGHAWSKRFKQVDCFKSVGGGDASINYETGDVSWIIENWSSTRPTVFLLGGIEHSGAGTLSGLNLEGKNIALVAYATIAQDPTGTIAQELGHLLGADPYNAINAHGVMNNVSPNLGEGFSDEDAERIRKSIP